MRKIQLGQWDTSSPDPFTHKAFLEWVEPIRRSRLPVVEPFAGAGNIPRMLPDLNWSGQYDVDPRDPAVISRDTIGDPVAPSIFPAVITNVPFLARNSAMAKGLAFPATTHDNLYKLALETCLKHPYVAAIVPESFLAAGLYQARLQAFVRLEYQVCEDTDYPMALALFTDAETDDFTIWTGDRLLGHHRDLAAHPLRVLPPELMLGFHFNAPNGALGIHAVDGRSGAAIAFVSGDQIPKDRVKRSSRHVTRVGLPEEWDPNISVLALIEEANKVLSEYRQATHDAFLTATKCRINGGGHRRRLDWNTARRILSIAARNLAATPRG